MGTQSHLPTIRLNELQTIGYQICPEAGERYCCAEENLAECLGVLHFPIEDNDSFIPLFWRLRPDSPGAVAFVATRRGESFLSHMVPSVTEVQKRNLLSDPIFQQEDLFAPATIGAARHAAKDVSLYKGAQSRPSTSSETTQRRPSSSSSASRGRTQSSSAPATPQRSQASSSSKAFYAPEEVARSPKGVFGGRSLSPICGPVGFRGVVPHHKPIHPELLHRFSAISHGDSSVPLLASKGMVSRSAGTSIRHSNRTIQMSRSAVTTAFPSVSRKSPYASSDCVATLKRFASQAGFSETVAGQLALCRRKSTRLNYQARWGKFRKWCRDFHHRSSEPTIPKIAEFLTFLFKTEKAAVSTIKGYRAMLSSVFKFCLPEISSSPILKDLVRSFEISAPRPLHHTPPWDLDKVLEYLSGPPFEPLAEASFRNKTRKALFLLAMATAKRIGELQALSFSVSHRGDDLVLHYDPFFLAKTESVSNPLPRSVIVQALADCVGDLPERVLCPVRAICYLRRAVRSVEFTPSTLFVSPSDPTRHMSKNTMSFFLRQ